jgi:hypothetical protein
MLRMTQRALLVLGLGMAACTIEEPATSTVDQYGMNMQGMNMQGMNMQGMNMQGMNMQGMNMQGFELGGVTLAGSQLTNVRVEKGELVANRGATTLRGTALVGAHLIARAASADDPPVIAQVEYRITAITAESSSYDVTHSGNTYLYTLEQYRAIPMAGASRFRSRPRSMHAAIASSPRRCLRSAAPQA